MRISVAGNVKSLSRPKSDFVKNFQKLEVRGLSALRRPLRPKLTARLQPASLKPPLFGSEVLGAQGKQPSGKAVICSMSTIESSFATHVAAGASDGRPNASPSRLTSFAFGQARKDGFIRICRLSASPIRY